MDSPEKTILPESWIWTTLMESCQYLSTGVEKYSGMIEYYSTGSIQDGYYKPEGIFSFSERPSRANRMVQQGDILQARMASTNKALSVNEELDGKLISTGFIQLRPFNCCKSMSSYIFYYIQSPDFFKQRDAFATGSTQVALTDNGARNLSFPLAPLPEQHRIVARIEQLFTNLDAGVESLKRSQVQLKRYRQSVLKSACEGRLVPTEAELARAEGRDYEPEEVVFERILEERKQKWKTNYPKKKYQEPSAPDFSKLPELLEGWYWATIEQLSSSEPRSIQSGPFGSALLHSEFQDSGILAIGIDNVLEGKYSMGKQHRISLEKFEQLKKFEARPQDVLITVMATIGRCCVIPNNLEPAIITKHVYRISVNQDLINPLYLMYCLLGGFHVRKQIFGQIRGQTRPGINGTILKQIAIPVPSLKEQHRIVAEVERRHSVADEMEKTIDQSIRQAERLRQSILKRAFEGKLVPQNPEDEPAGVLLERIRREKEIHEKNNKSKRRMTHDNKA